MSTSTSPVESRFGAEILDRLNSLESEVKSLREENEALESEVKDLRQKVDEDRQQHRLAKDDTQQDSNSTVNTLTDIEIADVPVGVLLSKALENAKDAQREVASIKEGTDTKEIGKEPEPQSPIEAYSRMRENGTLDTGKSVERAVAIYDHFRQWGQKTMRGTVISDGLRNLLSAAVGERLSWKQVYRSCEALERESGGKIEFTKKERQGWCLIAQDDGLSPSSVGREV